MSTKKQRNSTIELLKLLLMFGVVILHTCGGSGGAIDLGRGNNIDLEILRGGVICAVDCFIIISGYYLCLTNKRNISKVINLYIIAALFSLLITIASSVLNKSFSLASILQTFVVGNYFLHLYSAVYIFSPFINKTLDNITKKSFQILLMLMLLMFSIYPTFIEYLFARDETLMGHSFVSFFDGDGHGYTLVNFIFMYIIGAYLRKYGMPLKRKLSCLLMFILSSIIMALVMHYIHKVELNYFSPICIAASIALFNFFVLIKPSGLKFINYLSSTVYGVFIVHGFVLTQLKKVISIESIVSSPILQRLVGILLFAFIVFTISVIISIVLNALIDKLIMKYILRIKLLSYEIN